MTVRRSKGEPGRARHRANSFNALLDARLGARLFLMGSLQKLSLQAAPRQRPIASLWKARLSIVRSRFSNPSWVSAIDTRVLKQTCRVAFLITASLALVTVVALAMLLVAFVTFFRARRLYQEVMTTWLGQVILWLWGVRLDVHKAEPFPTTQTMYISNHTSTLDVFILIALGLPNTRFFIFGGTRRWLPLSVIGYLIGNFFTPPQTIRADRVRCFERAERILRRTGSSVYLSPEGERVTTGEIGPFNKGAFHLATNLQVPIVPLYINTPREIDPGTSFAARPGTVPVYVKPSISTRGWRLEDLERNRQMVRELYLSFHRTHQGD